MCWRREPKEEENQEIEIHTKNIYNYIGVLFCRCRQGGPATTLVFITQTARHHITDDSNDTAIPLQPWESPEGSRRLRLPDFKTIGT